MRRKEFYNADQKESFLSENEFTENMKSLFENVFCLSAPFEKECGMDVCCMDEKEIGELLNKLAGMRSYSSKNRENLLKRYVNWCVGTNKPGATGAIFNVTSDGLARFTERTLSGPEHLQRCLNSIFKPEEDGTADNILRGYCWLAFSGLSDTAIVNLSERDVELEARFVCSSGSVFPLYEESLPCMRVLREARFFKFSHPNYGDVILRPRADGDKLLRGLRSAEPSVKIIRSQLSQANQKAVKEQKTKIRLSYYRLWISGEFYRMLQMERTGMEVDFMYLAERGMLEKELDGKPYKLVSENATRTPESKKRELARNFREDYARWKLAYHLQDHEPS